MSHQIRVRWRATRNRGVAPRECVPSATTAANARPCYRSTETTRLPWSARVRPDGGVWDYATPAAGCQATTGASFRLVTWWSCDVYSEIEYDRLPDSQLREPGFESPLLPFQSLGIFVLSTTPQFPELNKWVPGYRQWWKYEWLVVACNCCVARMLPKKPSWCRNEQVCQGWSIKCFELFITPLINNIYYYTTLCSNRLHS